MKDKEMFEVLKDCQKRLEADYEVNNEYMDADDLGELTTLINNVRKARYELKKRKRIKDLAGDFVGGLSIAVLIYSLYLIGVLFRH